MQHDLALPRIPLLFRRTARRRESLIYKCRRLRRLHVVKPFVPAAPPCDYMQRGLKPHTKPRLRRPVDGLIYAANIGLDTDRTWLIGTVKCVWRLADAISIRHRASWYTHTTHITISVWWSVAAALWSHNIIYIDGAAIKTPARFKCVYGVLI